MKTCIACSEPLNEGSVCEHCATADGGVKSCGEIFEGGVQYFMGAVPGADRAFAEKLVRKNMNKLPYWKGNGCGCLEGEEASDEEFEKVLGGL